MGKADISSKWLLGEAPDEWVRWILTDPTLEVEAFLSAEFRHVLRLSDVLLRVRDAEGPFLLLIELQLHYDPQMPWRMQAYRGALPAAGLPPGALLAAPSREREPARPLLPRVSRVGGATRL